MKTKQEELSLGWLFFWFVVIPPIGYIWLFLEWWDSKKCIVEKNG